MRTKTNNELRIANIGEQVTLVGWCSKKRNLGGLVFIDLRDRYGITQLVIKPDNKNYELATDIKSEYVIQATGVVVERFSKNPQLPTGDIEIDVKELVILNIAENPPLLIQDNTDALEDTRMKYRYLDLRRPSMQNNFLVRHKTTMSVRNYLDQLDFLEIETPMLGKSTPEGARDFLVPSRVHQGEFYALPQSPQIYKQLLMISGFERYFQIVKCFRDEDLRADRQLEFTQIDLEMSFVDEETIYSITEGMLKKIWKDILNIKIHTPFPRLDYDYCMDKYGSDKPDTRFEMLLEDISKWAEKVPLGLFENTLNNGGIVKAIKVSNGAKQYSRKEIDRLTDYAKKYHAKGLAWLKYENNTFSGSIAKFINEDQQIVLIKKLNLENNDLVLIIADNVEACNFALGALRIQIAKEMNLIDFNKYNFLWVVNWPLFEYSEIEQRFTPAHHPFTAPQDGQEDLMLLNPKEVKAKAYDIVLNGYEIGGGSIRIHNQIVQNKMFEAIGMSKEVAQEKFSYFLEALKYGTPPHGGIALGLDRLVMLITNNNNLREIIAFPKAASARCLMSDAPSSVDQSQLDELGIKVCKV